MGHGEQVMGANIAAAACNQAHAALAHLPEPAMARGKISKQAEGLHSPSAIAA